MVLNDGCQSGLVRDGRYPGGKLGVPHCTVVRVAPVKRQQWTYPTCVRELACCAAERRQRAHQHQRKRIDHERLYYNISDLVLKKFHSFGDIRSVYSAYVIP